VYYHCNYKQTRPLCEGAAEGGNINILQWVKDNNNGKQEDWGNIAIAIAAARAGHINILDWLVQNNCTCITKRMTWSLLTEPYNFFVAAAQSGNIDLINGRKSMVVNYQRKLKL
jgi:hypothetical protein